ncbi:MAG: hypothetical protein SH856_13805 [Flavobacteriales bacterium]|nr:hypothetical protein [Flavobacteriales bacterium]
MKIIIALFCIYASLQSVHAQLLDIDSVYQKITSEKDESKRLMLLNTFFSGAETQDVMLDMQYAQSILTLAQKDKDKISEALALSQIGLDYMSFGNTVKGLEYKLKSIEVAETTNNLEMIADSKIHLALFFNEQGDFGRAIPLCLSGEETAVKAKNDMMRTWSNWLLGETYFELNKLDTALM